MKRLSPNHPVEAIRRPAAPLEAGSQFGSPSSSRRSFPAAVASDASSGAIPTGYLILNVTTGHSKNNTPAGTCARHRAANLIFRLVGSPDESHCSASADANVNDEDHACSLLVRY